MYTHKDSHTINFKLDAELQLDAHDCLQKKMILSDFVMTTVSTWLAKAL